MTGTGEQPQVHSHANALSDGRLTAPSATRNTGPIVAALRGVVPGRGRALEIASGTGQHVVAYAQAFPDIDWQPTDISPDRLISIDAWRAAKGTGNVREAQVLDATLPDWDIGRFDIVTVTNLFHLIPPPQAENVIAGAARALSGAGVFCLYGPFRENGAFRSAGDAGFHAQLTASDPAIGYKSMEWVTERAVQAGLQAAGRVEMPADNLFLVFRNRGPAPFHPQTIR